MTETPAGVQPETTHHEYWIVNGTQYHVCPYCAGADYQAMRDLLALNADLLAALEALTDHSPSDSLGIDPEYTDAWENAHNVIRRARGED
jgi:hypothetical protein